MFVWTLSYHPLRLFLDGMLVMMAVYGLLSFLQHRKTIYWQYALYIVCMVVTFQIDDKEYTRVDYRPGVNFLVTLLESVAFLLYIRFAILLTDMRQAEPRSYQLLMLMVWLLAGHVFIDTLLWVTGVSDGVRSNLYVANRLLLALGAFLVVPRIIRLRQPVMAYFILGSFFLVLGCLLALSVNFIPGLFTREAGSALTFPVTYMQVGVVLEVICFTMGMSLLNRQSEVERLSVQAELIKQLQENQRRQHQLDRIRAEIARDLHDEIGADLSSISMLSQAVERQIGPQTAHAVPTLQLIGESARGVLKKMRQIVWSLTDTPTTADAFSSRFSEIAHSLFDHQNVQLHLDMPPLSAGDEIPQEMKRAVFLTYKELLHNALRHANASNIYIRLVVSENELSLTVSDDGIGFSPANDSLSGTGLRSLQLRAQDLSGHLTITSEPGKGSCLTLTCPLTMANRSAEQAHPIDWSVSRE